MELSAEDRLDIHELYARYNHFFDAAEADRWAGLFTPDGTISFGPGGTFSSLELHGTAELAAHVRRCYQDTFNRRGIRHEVTNIVLQATETGARGMAYIMALRVGDHQAPQLTTTGRYEDDLVKGPDGWRFSARRVSGDG